MTQSQYLIKRKLNILELCEALGSISEACRKLGVSRHIFDPSGEYQLDNNPSLGLSLAYENFKEDDFSTDGFAPGSTIDTIPTNRVVLLIGHQDYQAHITMLYDSYSWSDIAFGIQYPKRLWSTGARRIRSDQFFISMVKALYVPELKKELNPLISGGLKVRRSNCSLRSVYYFPYNSQHGDAEENF